MSQAKTEDTTRRDGSRSSEGLGVRKAFERWCADTYGSQAYRHTSATSGEWEAWQASAVRERARLLDKARGVQAFLESCWRGANSNIGVDRDDVAIAIRSLQKLLDA